MPQAPVSVTLAIGSAPYQKTLVSSLLRAGMLRRVLRSGPYLEIQDPDADGSLRIVKRFPLNRFATRASWGIWRRLPAKLRGRPPVVVNALLSDHLWSGWIPRCSIFHGWMGLSLASFQASKRLGAVTLVENAGRHPKHWHQAGVDECRRFGINPRERSTTLPPLLIRRMQREYEVCDRIVVPSTVAYRSFAEFGLAAKTTIVATGVDTDAFSPRPQQERSLFRACFVGRVELAKGAGYLLQAWHRLALPNAELVLIGEVKPEMNALLRRYADSTVRTTGLVSHQQLVEHHRESDVFVFPSVNEGLAQVLLEAMASGLPAIASDHSGAADCVEDGKEGFVVPVRDVDRLAEAILWCYQHREETRAMGAAARSKIENQFTLEHYNQRQITLYQSLIPR